MDVSTLEYHATAFENVTLTMENRDHTNFGSRVKK